MINIKSSSKTTLGAGSDDDNRMRLCTAFSTIKLGKDSRYVVLHLSTLCNHPSLKCTKNQA